MIRSAKYPTARTRNHVTDAIPTTQADPVVESVHSALGSAVSKAKMNDLTESLAPKSMKKPCPRNEIFVDGKICFMILEG